MTKATSNNILKPLRPPMVDELNESEFHFIDRSVGGRPTQVRSSEVIDTMHKTQNALQTWTDNVAEKYTKPSNELLSIYEDAKKFVENLTGYDLSRVPLYKRYLNSMEGPTMSYYVVASNVETHVDVGDRSPTSHDYYLNKRLLAATLVHELMHATAGYSHKVVYTALPTGDAWVAAISGGLFSVEARVGATNEDLRLGHFMEEAAAEGAAARWRVADHHDTSLYSDKPVNLPYRGMPDLPYRYVETSNDYDYVAAGRGGGSYFSTSAYPAAGMDAISEHTGVDIFQLMIDARDPEKEAVARRKIIQAVESVKKGLYPILRDYDYTLESFVDGYLLILDAIEEDKQKKKQKRRSLGALAAAS